MLPEALRAFIVDEGNWMPLAMAVAAIAATALLLRSRRDGPPARWRIQSAMNLFFGATVGVMALGHLLAVTVGLADGTLGRSTLLLYAIGILLALPSVWLVRHALTLPPGPEEDRRRTLWSNGWLALTLLALGPANWPLAAPAAFNVGYRLHSRRAVGIAIVTVAILFAGALFVGALAFKASGQSFEQFSGME